MEASKEAKEQLSQGLNSVAKTNFDEKLHIARIERAIVSLQGAHATVEWAQEEIKINADKIAEFSDQSVDDFLSSTWPQIFSKVKEKSNESK